MTSLYSIWQKRESEIGLLRRERQQAIDALRRIANEKWDGAQCEEIARAALVNLGEQKP